MVRRVRMMVEIIVRDGREYQPRVVRKTLIRGEETVHFTFFIADEEESVHFFHPILAHYHE